MEVRFTGKRAPSPDTPDYSYFFVDLIGRWPQRHIIAACATPERT